MLQGITTLSASGVPSDLNVYIYPDDQFIKYGQKCPDGVGEKAPVPYGAHTIKAVGCNVGTGIAQLRVSGTNHVIATVEVPVYASLPNRAPVFGSGRDKISVEENVTAALETYSFSDPDNDTLTLSLSGTDAGDFSISSGGVLRFSSSPNYEDPKDAGRNNVYNLIVVASDGKLSVQRAVAVTVTNANEAPVFKDGDSTTRTVAENTPSGRAIGSPVGATDEDGDTLTYSLSGDDAGSFSIGATNGQLKTKAALNYEVTSSYSIRVQVTDGKGGSASIGVTVRVTNANDIPVFGVGASPERSVAENTPSGQPIGSPISATDEDGDTLTYSLSGDDAGSFSIGATNGQLKTKAALNHEAKDEYSVRVLASDGSLSAGIGVKVTVTDVTERPGAPGAPKVSANGQTGLTVSDWSAPSNTGPPITSYGMQYRKSGDTKWTQVSGNSVSAASLTTNRTISGLEQGTTYEVQVNATSDDGTSLWSASGSGSTQAAPPTPTPTATPVPLGKPAIIAYGSMIGGRGITFKWRPADGATGHKIVADGYKASRAVFAFSKNRVDITGLTPRKSYTFHVKAMNGNQSTKSNKVNMKAPKPTQSGHQADHTVKYIRGEIDVTAVGRAIATPVADWNKAMERLNKDLRICPDAKPNCDGSNSDKYTVTIKTSFNPGCDEVRACLDKSKSEDDHITKMTMIFEDPPTTLQPNDDGRPTIVEWEWTNIEGDDGKEIPGSDPARYYVYADRVMMHEFGHALGLTNFADDTSLEHLDALMNGEKTIHDEDIAQLRAIYLLHNRH